MSITLKKTLLPSDLILLPDDLIWLDEFSETAVVQADDYSVKGVLIRYSGIKQSGLVMTLAGTATSAWIDRGDLKSLHALQESNVDMTLILHDGRTFQVIFDYQKKGITASPIIDFNAPEDEDAYQLTIPLIRV